MNFRRFSSLRRLIQIRAWPMWAKAIAAVVSLVALVGMIAVGAVAAKYATIARGFDLDAVDEMQVGTLVRDREGEEIGRLFIEDRKFVTLDEVPQVLIDSVVATEDCRFFDHWGVDLRGCARSAVVNFKHGCIKQGGSTISQQLARHVYRMRGRNYDRKLTELFLALRMENRYSKQEILGHYLNRIYLGSGFYGVGSAARGYFGKEVGELQLEEAALLAGIIKSPSRFSPFNDPTEAKRVRDLTLGRMRDLDMISKERHASATASPVKVVPASMRDDRPYFAMEAVRREIEADYPEKLQLDGGEISSTLDNHLTTAAIQAIQNHLQDTEATHLECLTFDGEPSGPAHRLEGAAVVIENRTGDLIAAVGGRDFRTGSYDRAFLGRRPAGTSFLPFVYGSYFSIDRANSMAEVIDAPLDNKTVMVGGTEGMLGEWSADAGSFEGTLPASRAFIRSKTGATVRIGNEVGTDRLEQLTRSLGFQGALPSYPSTYLGATPVSLIEMARAFSAFANDGSPAPEPHLIHRLSDRQGGRFEHTHEVSSTPDGLQPEAAMMVRQLMVARLREPSYDVVLHRHGLSGGGLAGQAGSSYHFEDGWFIGFDKNITCAVWVGYADGRPLPVKFPGKRLAMPIWAEIMQAATSGRPDGWQMSTESENAFCLVSGQPATDECLEDPDHLVVDGDAFLSRAPEATAEATADAPPKAIPVAQIREGTRVVAPQGAIVVGEDPYRLPTPDPSGPSS